MISRPQCMKNIGNEEVQPGHKVKDLRRYPAYKRQCSVSTLSERPDTFLKRSQEWFYRKHHLQHTAYTLYSKASSQPKDQLE